MPGTPMKRDELDDLSITPDQKVCRYSEPVNLPIKGMTTEIQLVAEQSLNILSPVFSGRHTDRMDDQGIDLGAFRAVIAIGGRGLTHPRQQSGSLIYNHDRSLI